MKKGDQKISIEKEKNFNAERINDYKQKKVISGKKSTKWVILEKLKIKPSQCPVEAKVQKTKRLI